MNSSSENSQFIAYLAVACKEVYLAAVREVGFGENYAHCAKMNSSILPPSKNS